MYNAVFISEKIKSKAMAMGFDAIGISKAGFLEKEAAQLENWLKSNKQGQLSYMDNYFDLRVDPTKLVPGAKSVISLMYNYFTTETPKHQEFKISKYAYGNDYHEVIKNKLFTLVNELKTEIGQFNARVFVDSAPVLEKAWAAKSGLGWIGKNSNLISKKRGSFFFLAEIILDLELETDSPVSNHCGNCTACVDACPTQAITPYQVDASKCISYFTIELKDQIPSEMQGKWDSWIFGCDICMDVCPWNRFSIAHQEPQFTINEIIKNYSSKEWLELTEPIFNDKFKKSPIQRAKFSGLKRNIQFITKNNENK
jgi:epoxyqueuosine reductase